MLNTSFFKKILLAASVILLYSCDKDYNVVGSDLIGDNGFDYEIYDSNVIAYNQKITPVASNNLALNALGIYDDPAFGTNTANFVTQVNLSSYAPTIGEEAVIDSVVMTIPYFSHVEKVNTDGSSTFILDSISGSTDGKLKLSVYESGYYLKAYDPNSQFQDQQLYYTNENSTVDNLKGTLLNDAADQTENGQFFFNKKQIVITTKDTVTDKETKTYRKPEMRLHLNKDYFQNKILNASASNLASANAFNNYFRGLYFKVEKSGASPSNMALLNFKDTESKITIYYKAKTASTTDDEKIKEAKNIAISLTGNTISLQEESNPSINYSNATNTANINTVTGDDKLYLRGGQGSMAILELFSKTDQIGYDANGNLTGANGVSDELDDLRQRYKNNELLINEANLTFYIDTELMKNSDEPNRIYLYDLTNKQALIDIIEPSLFDGILTKNTTTEKGISYKVRITDQIRNLVKNTDSTNVKLGLVVTQSIAALSFNKLKTPITIPNTDVVIPQVPQGSVMNNRGTILYGGTTNVDSTKRLKLQIYYTKPN